MLHYGEISVSELPITYKKEEGQLTIEEIVYLGEKLNDYKEVAFLEINEDKELYEKLYAKK